MNINTKHQLTKDDAVTVINFIKRNNSVGYCNSINATAKANKDGYIIEFSPNNDDSSDITFLVNQYMNFKPGAGLDYFRVENLDDVLALINELGLTEFKVEA